jgi:hypothetical protein
VVGLLRYYATNLGCWAAFAMGFSYFLGLYDEFYAFFQANRPLMLSALLLHFVLCAIIYDASQAKRLTKRAIKVLEKQR